MEPQSQPAQPQPAQSEPDHARPLGVQPVSGVLPVGEPELFRTLVESVTDYAIFVLSAEGIVSSWNAGAQRIKGYEASEIIGQHFSRFYPAEAVARGWPDDELRRAKQLGRFEDEGWRVR